jgi:hypothetical protein
MPKRATKTKPKTAKKETTTTHIIVQRSGDRKTEPMILAVQHNLQLERGDYDFEEKVRLAFEVAALNYRLTVEYEDAGEPDLRWCDVMNIEGEGFQESLKEQGILAVDFVANAEVVAEWDDDLTAKALQQ